jgi:hypothetical protein
MERLFDLWSARIALALCIASRWLSGPSLVLTALAWAALVLTPRAVPCTALLLVIVAGGAAQIYIAFRIEFDRRIFDAWAHDTDADAARRFDTTMRALDLLPPNRNGRADIERVRGVIRLVKSSGWLFSLQVACLVLVGWMCR